MIENIILIITSIISAIATYILSVKCKQGPVKASALLSFLVGTFFLIFPSLFPETLSKSIPLVFFGASFVGMSSVKRISNNLWMAFAGMVFGLIFINSSKFFSGYGGGLGTTACLSVVITLGLINFWQKLFLKSQTA